MRLDVRNMTQQQIADANNQWLAQNSQPFTGQPKLPMQSDMGAVGGMPLMPMLPMGVPPMGVPPMGFGPGVNNFGAAPGIGNPMQDAFQRFLSGRGQGAGGTPPIRPMSDPFKPIIERAPGEQNLTPEQLAAMEKRRLEQNALDNLGPTQEELARNTALYGENGSQRALVPQWQPQGPFSTSVGYNPVRRSDEGIPNWLKTGQFNPNQPVGFAGGTGMPPAGGTGMPPAGGTGMPPMGGGLPYNNGFNNPGQPQQPMTQPAVGTPFNKPTGPQVQPPMTQPPAGGGTGTSPQPYNNGFYNPGQPPMAMKKGGLAVKPVWDKERPDDLGKPKDLSVKRKKSAKARAKAAGRPYPNLIDNMAAARKKGK